MDVIQCTPCRVSVVITSPLLAMLALIINKLVSYQALKMIPPFVVDKFLWVGGHSETVQFFVQDTVTALSSGLPKAPKLFLLAPRPGTWPVCGDRHVC